MRKITEYTLRKASEHIYYEALMFFETASQLSTANNQISVNILLDDFAIHTRNLFEFLYPKEGLALRKRPPKKTDILVTDYIDRLGYYRQHRTKKSELMFVWRKASKQVNHLTYTRNRYTPATKPWNFSEIVLKMSVTLNAFHDALPDRYKKWPFFTDFSKLLTKYSSCR